METATPNRFEISTMKAPNEAPRATLSDSDLFDRGKLEGLTGWILAYHQSLGV